MASDYPQNSDDELVGRAASNVPTVPTEVCSVHGSEIENSDNSTDIVSASHVIHSTHQNEIDISQSDYITDDSSISLSNSEFDRLQTPRPSISQDSGVICADYAGGHFASSTRNNSVRAVSRESFEERFPMKPTNDSDLGDSAAVVFFKQSLTMESGSPQAANERKLLFKGLRDEAIFNP